MLLQRRRSHVLVLVAAAVLLWYMYYPWNKQTNQPSESSEPQAVNAERSLQNQYETAVNASLVNVSFPETCAPNKTFMNFSKPLTALASFPGSGNTWVRHLLEEATGYYTGSVYGDGDLMRKGFRGEGRVRKNVVAVKTHRYRNIKPVNFDRTLLIVRSPYRAFLAEFNRQKSGMNHKGYARNSTYNRDWAHFFTNNAVYYKYFHEYWLHRPGPKYVIDYEVLKMDLREELRRILKFLGFEVSEERLECVAYNSEGPFHRKPKANQFDPYTDEMKEILNDLMTDVVRMRNRTFWDDPLWIKAASWA